MANVRAKMEVIELAAEMQTISERLRRRDGAIIRLIPTMGALHAGHASLIEAAATCPSRAADDNNGLSEQSSDNQSAPVLVVSIFTNPIQFNNPSDYQNYPKTLEGDLELCRRLGVRYVFAPTCREMYPARGGNGEPGDTATMVMPPGLMADQLEGRSRKGHFGGMLTVVCKLFNIVKPHEAYFGEKDYQQLRLVDQMVRDLNMPVVIVAGKTRRDPDLLPLSSRNVRLSADQRRLAPLMTRILLDAKSALEQREPETSDLNAILLGSMLATMWLHLDEDECDQLKVDYLELRCSKDVSEISYQAEYCGFDCRHKCASKGQTGDSRLLAPLKTRLLTSVIVGQVRLLDNIEVVLNSNLTLAN